MKCDAFGASTDTGKENRYRNFFLLYLSVHWGDLIEQIKKSVIYTLNWIEKDYHWKRPMYGIYVLLDRVLLNENRR